MKVVDGILCYKAVEIYRGYLLFEGEYISSSTVKKSVFFTSENADISQNEMKYIWYSPQKSKFSFYFILNGKYRQHNLTFSSVVSHSI